MQRAEEIAFFFGQAMEFDFASLAAKFFQFVQSLFVHWARTLYCGRGRVQQGTSRRDFRGFRARE